MLRVQVRHTAYCKRKSDIYYTRCRCPKWIRGVLNGKQIREAASTRSWEQAERKLRAMEAAQDSSHPSRPIASSGERAKLVDVLAKYRADEDARDLSKETTKQTKSLFAHLEIFAADKGMVYLDELTTDRLSEFRAIWGNNGQTANRKRSRLSSLIEFARVRKWFPATEPNPARAIKASRERRKQTERFTLAEFQSLVDATCVSHEWRGGRDFHNRADRVRAFILTARWTGFGIQDVVSLERSRLQKSARSVWQMNIQRKKTDKPVFTIIPSDVAELLMTLPNSDPRYFFWSGNGDLQSACKGWRRTLANVFKAANLKNPDNTPKRCHPHMFRHTFAGSLLDAGTPMRIVAKLLGDTVAVCEKHYSGWDTESQEAAEEYIMRTIDANSQRPTRLAVLSKQAVRAAATA